MRERFFSVRHNCFRWGKGCNITCYAVGIIKKYLKISGKGPSIWDVKAHEKDYINNNENGDVACDSYHRYKEDVRLLKDLGVILSLLKFKQYYIYKLSIRNIQCLLLIVLAT